MEIIRVRPPNRFRPEELSGPEVYEDVSGTAVCLRLLTDSTLSLEDCEVRFNADMLIFDEWEFWLKELKYRPKGYNH